MPGERARYFFSKILYARKSTLTRVCYNGDEKDYGEHMLSIAKFGKIALITGALLMIAALICLASFAEVGRGTSGAYAADGVADKVISEDVYTEDFVKIDTGLGVSARDWAFPLRRSTRIISAPPPAAATPRSMPTSTRPTQRFLSAWTGDCFPPPRRAGCAPRYTPWAR